jgi:hypothetical protein
MIKLAILGLAAALCLLAAPLARPARAEDPGAACTSSPQRVGQCLTVHGRMTSCTAVPSIRIWVVGTKRVLGVEDAEGNPGSDAVLPPDLDAKVSGLSPCSKAAWGDFTVCPLTASKPGVMQRVCLAKTGKVRITDF